MEYFLIFIFICVLRWWVDCVAQEGLETSEEWGRSASFLSDLCGSLLEVGHLRNEYWFYPTISSYLFLNFHSNRFPFWCKNRNYCIVIWEHLFRIKCPIEISVKVVPHSVFRNPENQNHVECLCIEYSMMIIQFQLKGVACSRRRSLTCQTMSYYKYSRILISLISVLPDCKLNFINISSIQNDSNHL